MQSFGVEITVTEPRVLTDLAFNVLVALTGEPLHGYALLKRLRELEGRESLRTGTVYAALARLQEEGWVTEVEDHGVEGEDERRRTYRITDAGLAAARGEAERLAAVVERARRRALLPETSRG